MIFKIAWTTKFHSQNSHCHLVYVSVLKSVLKTASHELLAAIEVGGREAE